MIWQLIDSSSVGGAERHIATISSSLKRSGHKVKVVLYQDHGSNPWLRQLRDEDLEVEILGGTFASLRRTLGSERPSLVHTHGYKAGILGRIAARFAGIPVVSTYHSGERGRFPVGLYDFADEWTGILAQRIAVSPAIQERLPFSSRFIPSYVIPPPTPSHDDLPRRIAFIGRLSHEKAPDLFCLLAQRHPEAGEWHVFGDGPMRGELEDRFKTTVRFHGVVTNLSDVWANLGLVVMPSRFEGIPLVALEAGAHGVPVLAAKVGGLGEVVVQDVSGWLFDKEDMVQAAAGLAAWTQRLAGGAHDEVRRACWDAIGQRYSEARWLPEIIAVYRAAGWTEDR